MELLARTFHALRRLLGPDAWFTCGVLAVLATLEIAGRRESLSDAHDLLTVLVLCLVACLVRIRHQQQPLAWVSRLQSWWRRGRDWVQERRVELGIDFRGTPPLPQTLPPTTLRALGVLLLISAVLLFLLPELPQGLRLLVHVSYLAYVAVWVLLLTVMVLCISLALPVSWALIHDAFVSRFGRRDRNGRRWEMLVVFAWFGGLVLAARLLPPWVALAGCALVLLINLCTVLIPSNQEVTFVWRFRNGDPRIRCVPWAKYHLSEFLQYTLLPINLVLLACGSLIAGDAQSAFHDMPVMTNIGLILAWLAPSTLGLLLLQSVLGRLRDPARPCRPVVHIGGADLAARRPFLESFFRLRGWDVRFAPAAPQQLDVCVDLVPGAEPDMEATWPLRIDAAALQSDTALQRLARRDEIQMRRRLVAGLEHLFKQTARRRFRCGTGFWLAPHFWFVPGLTRDLPEDDLEMSEGTLLTGIIGPPFHRLLPRPVRHHTYRMLRALQIDLIFIEDGVSFKRFLRVLRMLFEIYDVHGGRRRAEEVHFHGLPGTRILIHEFVLQEPFRSETYPEPEYENLGRARILHVFRDRGGQEDPLETPEDFSHLPAPSLAR